MALHQCFASLAAGAAVVFAGAWSTQAQAQETRQAVASDSVIETIKQRGVLEVGLSTFVPWAMLDEDGELMGFEIDVAERLARDMGVEVNFTPTAWDGIIPALLDGKFDLIVSGMSVTPERNLTVNFTEPYAYSGLKLIANADFDREIASIEDLDDPDVTFALRRGATPVAYVQENLPNAEILQFDEEGAQLQEVINGGADVLLASEPGPSNWLAENPDRLIMPIDDLINASAEAIALRKGDPDAINFLNNWIDARWRDGFLRERHDYWFTTTEWQD